jgi:hypothetical protein
MSPVTDLESTSGANASLAEGEFNGRGKCREHNGYRVEGCRTALSVELIIARNLLPSVGHVL